MPGDLNSPVALIGCGYMAKAYAEVLSALEMPFEVVGRREETAQKFFEDTGIRPVTGGLSSYLASGATPARAISAVDVASLDETVQLLLAHGVKDILVEKPAGLTPKRVQATALKAQSADARVIVAYNRRFYASVREARSLIDRDGGLLSMHFDFTERSRQIAELGIEPEVKQNWFYANSSHIADLAFYLAGTPVSVSAQVAGALDWHPKGSVFVGHGETSSGALFSYHADWSGPGRWGIELVTAQRKLILQPIEELRSQAEGSFAVSSVEIADELDKQYKPGLFRQTRAFLSGEDDDALLSLEEHAQNMSLYKIIVEGGMLQPA